MPESPGIQVSVNGEAAAACPPGSTLADLLREPGASTARGWRWSTTCAWCRGPSTPALRLNHGDQLEIVTFVGGG